MISAAELLGIVTIRGADEGVLKLARVGASADSAGEKLAGLAVGGTVLAAAGLVALGAAAVKMDADLQQGINRLRTGGGDIQDTFASLRTGIQQVAVATGTLTGQLIPAMYLIVGAGQRGAEAMNTLKVASEGAQIEQANVADVANVVSGVMTNYGTKLYNATQYMNGLIYAVAHGKITLQDLSTAMGPIDPIAQQLGIHMQDVAAAMTTQTNAMIPAARAATGLRFMMMALENPTKKARDEMSSLGLDSVKVGDEMKVSLPGALEMITKAALKVGPEGSVPFNRAVGDMVGGLRGLSAFLGLTGPHMQDFINNAKNIGSAMADSTTQVKGWDIAQSNLNIKLDQGRAMLEVLGQNVGELLLPYVIQLLGVVTPLVTSFGDWATSTQGLAGDINQLASFVTYLVRDLQGNGAIKEFGAILSDIGSTVNNVVNTALSLLGTIFGTTASNAGKASDAATNVANGFKRVLDTVKPLTDAMSWLSSQFTDTGAKGQILRGALLTIGGVIAGIKIAEFASALGTALANAGLDVQYFGAKLLGMQYAADIDAMSLTKVGVAAQGAGTSAAAARGWFVQLEATLDGDALAATQAGTAFGGMGTSVKGLGLAMGPIIGIATGVTLALQALPPVADGAKLGFHNLLEQFQLFSMSTALAPLHQGTQQIVLDFHNMYQGATTDTARLKSGVTISANQMSSGLTETVTYMQAMASGKFKILHDDGSNYTRNLEAQVTTNFFNMHKQVYSETNTMSDDAVAAMKRLNGDMTQQAQSMDANVIGYWNDVANYIAGHPINGNITYTTTAGSYGGNVGATGHHFASGTNYAPGGWSWVGELGPELAYIPRGAQIIPHNQSMGAPSAASVAGRPVVIQFVVNGRQLAQAALPDFVQAIREATGAKF